MATRETTPLFTISAAAEMAGMHAQTLRQYDRLGIVVPARTRGGGRRYSARDVRRLREVQRLSTEEGVNLAGIQHIFRLHSMVDDLQEQNERLRAVAEPGSRVFHAGPAGEVVALPRGRRGQVGRPARAEDEADVDAQARRPADALRGRRRAAAHEAALVLWRPMRPGG